MAQLTPDIDLNVGLEEIRPGERVLSAKETADATAIKLVVQDAMKAEGDARNRMLLTRWKAAEDLYMARLPQVVWEGTNVPRASLGMPVVFDCIDALHPQTMNALFSVDPPFECTHLESTSEKQARAVKVVVASQLKDCDAESEMNEIAFDAFLYGNSVGKWSDEVLKTSRFKVRKKVNYKPDTNAYQEEPDETTVEPTPKEMWKPKVEHIELRHILVDPSLRYPDIRRAKWVIHRIYKTVEELDRLRDHPSYTIPDEDVLNKLAFPPIEQTPSSPMENTALDINLEFRMPRRNEAGSVDPLKKPLELLEYWTPDWVYVILNRTTVIRNERNPWGKLPFVSAYWKRQRGTFWALGVADLVGNEQKLQQGVINTFLDGLSLQLLPMMVRERGKNVFPQHLRMRPGGVIDVDGGSQGTPIAPLAMKPIDPNIFSVLGESEARAQKHTAANDMVMQGSIPQGRNSITSTATGMQAVSAAVGVRMQDFVKAFEKQVFVPVLDAFYYMDIYNLKPSDIKRILDQEMGDEWNELISDPLEVLNATVKFGVLASSRLAARQAMLATLPQLSEFLMQQPIQDALQSQSKKLDFSTLEDMWFEMTGYERYKRDLIVDMTEEDKAQLASENQMALQQQQQAIMEKQHQMKMEEIQAEHIGRAGRDVIKSTLKQGEDKQASQDKVAEMAGMAAATGGMPMANMEMMKKKLGGGKK